jgi:hypothetical protein
MNGDVAQLICSLQKIIFSTDNSTRTEWLFDGTKQSGHNLKDILEEPCLSKLYKKD